MSYPRCGLRAWRFFHSGGGGAHTKRPSRPPRGAPGRGRMRRGVKKCRRGRRKSLKRLDSAKEIEEFYLDFLPQRLGFPSEILDFPSGEIWISFIALEPAFYA